MAAISLITQRMATPLLPPRAWRQRTKQLGTQYLCRAAIAEGARAFRGRPGRGLELRGRGNPLRAFNPLSNDDAEQSWLKKYDAAFAQLEAGDPAAMSAFASHMGAHSEAP